jgi:septum site-determining protein MinD
MARKIVITSGKGGVGKTTVAVNLGTALSELGLRVLLVDLDFNLNNLDVAMGVENLITFDLLDVIEGRCRLKQALVQSKTKKNLYVLPSGRVNYSSRITGQNVKLIVDSLDKLFDYIFIDCPAGIDVGFHRAVSCVDEALIVVNSSLTSLRDADKVISILKSYRLGNVMLVINRVRGDLIANQKTMTPIDIEKLLKIDLLGVLPEEDAVFLSCGFTLPKTSDSKKAYKIFANNIHKNTKKIYDTTLKYTGFFGSIRRSIKKSI